MTDKLNCCDSYESLKLKVAKGRADTPGCGSVGNYVALCIGRPADKLSLGELNDILLYGQVVDVVVADNGRKGTSKHQVL